MKKIIVALVVVYQSLIQVWKEHFDESFDGWRMKYQSLIQVWKAATPAPELPVPEPFAPAYQSLLQVWKGNVVPQ